MSIINPLHPGQAQQAYTHDLYLICARNESVLVSSTLLKYATRSPAVIDIIDKLIEQHPDASARQPMELPVPEDSAAVWQVAWRLVRTPMAVTWQGLCWANIEEVIRLADKYALPQVLQACEMFIVTCIAKNTTSTKEGHVYSSTEFPFGFLRMNGEAFSLQLSFLELLSKDMLAPYYAQSLHKLTSQQKALLEQLPQAQRVEYSRLSAELSRQIQAMHAALSSFSNTSNGSEAAERVVELVHQQMAMAVGDLA